VNSRSCGARDGLVSESEGCVFGVTVQWQERGRGKLGEEVRGLMDASAVLRLMLEDQSLMGR